MTGVNKSINNYFDSVTYWGLCAAVPSTIIISSIFFVIGNSDNFSLISKFEYSIIPKVSKAAFLSSLLGVIICFWEIVRLQLLQYSVFSYRKSLVNAALIFIHISYSVIIFLFIEFSKFGNIPVGRN